MCLKFISVMLASQIGNLNRRTGNRIGPANGYLSDNCCFIGHRVCYRLLLLLPLAVQRSRLLLGKRKRGLAADEEDEKYQNDGAPNSTSCKCHNVLLFFCFAAAYDGRSSPSSALSDITHYLQGMQEKTPLW